MAYHPKPAGSPQQHDFSHPYRWEGSREVASIDAAGKRNEKSVQRYYFVAYRQFAMKINDSLITTAI